jgi:hypothetical protein
LERRCPISDQLSASDARQTVHYTTKNKIQWES